MGRACKPVSSRRGRHGACGGHDRAQRWRDGCLSAKVRQVRAASDGRSAGDGTKPGRASSAHEKARGPHGWRALDLIGDQKISSCAPRSRFDSLTCAVSLPTARTASTSCSPDLNLLTIQKLAVLQAACCRAASARAGSAVIARSRIGSAQTCCGTVPVRGSSPRDAAAATALAYSSPCFSSRRSALRCAFISAESFLAMMDLILGKGPECRDHEPGRGAADRNRQHDGCEIQNKLAHFVLLRLNAWSK